MVIRILNINNFPARALTKVQKYQKPFDLVIPKSPFQRLVREITENVAMKGMKFQKSVLEVLEEVAEAYLVGLF